MDLISVKATYAKPKHSFDTKERAKRIAVEESKILAVQKILKTAGTITRQELIKMDGIGRTIVDRIIKLLLEQNKIFITYERVGKCQHKLINYRED